jgi:conjugative transfer signal peptidase TraF
MKSAESYSCAPARSRRAYSLIWWTAIAISLAAVKYARSNLHVNFTGSLPIGVYRRVPGSPVRGDLVVVCLPRAAGEFARSRGYVWRGGCPGRAAPVGKVVLALPGDTVTETPAGLFLNGRAVPNSRVVLRDSRGRPIPHLPFGRYVVKPDHVWLFSPFHPMSFDSRYFGPVAARLVRSRITPLVPPWG